ncbi:MAG TPA: TIGR03067 domain-containing protein [Gemmataceae bacterium]|nr:TIGR03067 domain-containing protein [Gemmataceae bacterium]
MLKRITLVVLLMLLCISGSVLPAAQDKGGAAKTDLEKFQGTWVFVTTEEDGKPGPKFKRGSPIQTITFQGDKFEVKQNATVVQAGTQKLDPSKNPKTLDATVTEGEGKGTIQLGIYEMMGDSLRACFDRQGKSRPTEFKANAGSGYYLATVLRDVGKGVSRNDPSIVYDEPFPMNTGFKSYNGKAYDKAFLCIGPKTKLVLPDKNTEVGQHDLADVVHIFMEKRASIGGHFAFPTSITTYRNRLGCAVKLEKGAILIGSWGEYGFLEGAVAMRLLIMVPPKVDVERQVGLIGGYGGRAAQDRAPEMINPTRDDPKPALTKTKKDTPDCWLPPTAEDGWHEIPAVTDTSRRVSEGLKVKK